MHPANNKPIAPHNYHLHFESNNAKVCFTRRETECILHLLDGNTISQVAGKLGLAISTVEYTLNNMQTKMDCVSLQQLLSTFVRAEFTQFQLAG